jgi:hypothetical protein
MFKQCKPFGLLDPEDEGTIILPNVKKYPKTRRHVPEESNLQDQRFKVFKPHKL